MRIIPARSVENICTHSQDDAVDVNEAPRVLGLADKKTPKDIML